MTLRTINNPTTDINVMTAIKNILATGTQLAAGSTSGTGLEQIYIESKYTMSLGNFPAVHLFSGQQKYHKNGQRTYMGVVEVFVEYYDRWDTQPNTIDAIWANIALDLERIKSNIESNDSLMWNNVAFSISVPDTTLSPYKGEIDTQFPGLSLPYRTLSLSVNVLPYDC